MTNRRPNIIFCMTDDQGWGDTAYNGHPELRTPHLNAMSREGIRFDRFYAAAPVCSPTRGSVVTGRHPYRYGITFANVGHMKKEEVTIAEVLKEFGYTTGHFGKWHLGTLTRDVKDGRRGGPDTVDYAPPWEHGFDACFSTEVAVPTWDPMRDQPIPGKYWTGPGEYATENLDGDDSRVIMDRALPFIRSAVEVDTPFLAVIWFHSPHCEVRSGGRYLEMYRHLDEDKQHYYGCITAMDEQVGRLRQELASLGVEGNTMLWFCSDNGPAGEGGGCAQHAGKRQQGSPGPFRGRKGSLYEGGVRVPGLLVWPDEVTETKTVTTACSTLDYFPTVMELLGYRLPERKRRPYDGVSLLPVVRGDVGERTHSIGFESGSQAALVDKAFKLISNDRGRTFELYDLTSDPRETMNVADRRPDIVREMGARLLDWRTSCARSAAGGDYDVDSTDDLPVPPHLAELAELYAHEQALCEARVVLQIESPERQYGPLDEVAVSCPLGTRLRMLDGDGDVYGELVAEDSPCVLRVGGALGTHTVLATGVDDRLLGTLTFRVEAETCLSDGKGDYERLLRDLFQTMSNSCGGDGATRITVDGKLYKYFICWLRDHTHTMKGMKYFDSGLKTALELYADTQRDDGMVYDRIAPKADVQGWRDYTFREGDFIKTLSPGTPNSATMQRIPVENDVEYLFVECLYYTWKATGDTDWMRRYLDPAIRAVTYGTSDPYRWSNTFALLKRGYTIDTWDFMHEDDVKLTLGDNVCDLRKTTFGVMHGDNTGMAASCRYLAEMLRTVGREDEAGQYDTLADELLGRLERLAWTGGYYRHHVSEDPSFRRDVGDTDEAAQVSLSNTYALNRGIGEDKCAAILETYQRIRSEMPASSPGEFYNLYPPFERGFDKPDRAWQYMNGGVSAIAAGELARGAFEHGFEAYGTDILARVKQLADRHGGRLHTCFNGCPQSEPERSFTALGLGCAANVSPTYAGTGGWGDPGNDLSRLPMGDQAFAGVPFRLGVRGLGLSTSRPGYSDALRVPVGGAHRSMYLLHAASSGHPLVAELDVCYQDGAQTTVYLMEGQHLDSWFMPGSGENRGGCHHPKWPKGWPDYQLAWRGGNDTFDNVGVFVWGWDNPRPDVPISELVFRAPKHGGAYFAPAITFCDSPVWFPQSDVSFGIPDAWGAAAVVYAIIEGLAGVVDTGVAFDHATVSPRWGSGDEFAANVVVTYPASGGYVAYEWEGDDGGQRLHVTGSCREIHLRLLVPEGREPGALSIDGKPLSYCVEHVGRSCYVIAPLFGKAARCVELRYNR